jgi:hypothetical protein
MWDSVVLSRPCPSLCVEVMLFCNLSLSLSLIQLSSLWIPLSFNKSYMLRDSVLNLLLSLNLLHTFVICQQISLIQFIKSF